MTARIVIPLIYGIEAEIKELNPTSNIAESFVNNMLHQIHYHLSEIEMPHIFAIAMLLDPRFKLIEFNDINHGSRALKYVKKTW